jgi:ABC-type glycerol-3-phosphate transport system substrate-binding protein
MTVHMMRRLAVILAATLTALAALSACKLVDQTTFAPSPEAAPKPVATAVPVSPPDKRTPLVAIGFGTPNPDYHDLLAYAVQQAEERRPDVAFDVVSAVPATGDTVAQSLAASRGGDDAAQVMQAMMALGVPDTRIHLGARTEAGLSERQVRVYIR